MMADPKMDYGCKIGHRRVDEAGQVTYKKTTTSELMAAIQLGIEHSIGKLLPMPKRDVLYEDFHVVEAICFPREGSNLTPAHRCRDFQFKTYAPTAFRYFRDIFGIQPDDFLLSLCNEPLQELSNPGASGSIFYVTNDDEFIIKTVQHKESEFLQKLLPGYYMNLNQNPRTLLPKFYGLYCYQCGGKNIRFVIMNNLLPSSVVMHFKYDLKGSTYKRKASVHELTKSSPTYKDLDFLEHLGEGILLEADTHNALLKTIEKDCRVLQSFKIMDYSMLLGIHNLDQSCRSKGMEPTTSKCVGGCVQGPNQSRSLRRLAQYSTAMESIHATSSPLNVDSDDVPTGGIPARNVRSERLLLYIGVIDILQSYRFTKKIEHALKSIVTDGDSISVHRPGFYAHRFQSFFENSVFKIIPPPAQNITSKRKLVIDTQKSTNGQKSPVLDKPFVSGKQGAVIGRPDVLPKSVNPLSLFNNQPRSPKPILPAKPVKEKPLVLPKRTKFPEASLTSDELTAASNATKDLKQNAYTNECRERIYRKHVKPPRNAGLLVNAGGGSSSSLAGTACSASRITSDESFLPSNSSSRLSDFKKARQIFAANQ